MAHTKHACMRACIVLLHRYCPACLSAYESAYRPKSSRAGLPSTPFHSIPTPHPLRIPRHPILSRAQRPRPPHPICMHACTRACICACVCVRAYVQPGFLKY